MASFVANDELIIYRLGPEAVLLGFHGGNAELFRFFLLLSFLDKVFLSLELYKVDTSSGLIFFSPEYDIKVKGASHVVWPVGPILILTVSAVEDKGIICNSG